MYRVLPILSLLILVKTLQAQQPLAKSFNGDWRTTTQISDRNTPFQVLPANYIASEANVRFDAIGLPIQANLRLNSAHQQGEHQLNSFTLQLDIQRWKAELQQQLLEKVLGKGIDSTDHQVLLAALEQQRGKRIADLHIQLEQRYGGKLPKPDLSKFVDAKQKLPGLKSVLRQPLYENASSKWQTWKEKLGDGFESRMGEVRDSLLKIDPNSYDKLLHDRMILQQYKRILSRKQEMEKVLAKQDKLKPIVDDYAAMQRLEDLPMSRWIEGMNPEESMALLKELDTGLLGTLNGLLQRIETLQVGNTSPSYTASSLDAVIVSGFNTAFRFGKLLLGGTGGSIQPSPFVGNGLPWSGALQPGGKRVLAGKVGFGSKESYVQAFAMSIHLPVQSDSTMDLSGDVHNRIVGINSAFSLFKDRIRFSGDWQYSSLRGGALLRDSKGLPIDWEEPLELDESHQDNGYCWNVNVEAALIKNLHLDASYRSLSEGYVSLGTPFMSHSADRYSANLRYQLAQGKLVSSLFVRRDEDPATAFKLGRSLSTQYGANIVYRPSEKLPWLQVQFVPFSQMQQSQSEIQESNGSLLSGNLGYSFRLNNLWFQSTAAATVNTSNQFSTSPSSQSVLYSLRQQCQIGECGGLAVSFTRIGAEYSEDFQKTNAFDIAGFMVMGKAFRTDLGMSLIDEEGEQGVGRKSLYLISQAPIGDKLIIELHAERNMLENTGSGLPDVNEYLVRSGCTFRF